MKSPDSPDANRLPRRTLRNLEQNSFKMLAEVCEVWLASLSAHSESMTSPDGRGWDFCSNICPVMNSVISLTEIQGLRSATEKERKVRLISLNVDDSLPAGFLTELIGKLKAWMLLSREAWDFRREQPL